MSIVDFLHTYELQIFVGIICTLGVGIDYLRHQSLTTRRTSRYKKAAQNPPISKRWLRKIPEGIVIGTNKSRNRYFCIPADECLSVTVFGGSGSGKSAGPLLCSLLSNMENKANEQSRKRSFNAMVIDLKGELHEHMPEDSYLLIDPTDRPHSVGWNPYYRLDAEIEPSDDLKIQVFSGLAESFIPSGSPENAFFTENATSLLAGFLCWGYEHEYGMVDMVLKILTSNAAELLQECLAGADEESVSYSWLAKFSGTETTEAFQNFTSEMSTKLSCFKLQEVQYILRDNYRRIGPDAVRKNDVFLSVPDHLLTESQFSPIFRMIIEQEMTYLTLKLPPKDTRPVLLCVDELFAVGGGTKGKGLSNLEKFLSICRGYKAFCLLALQGQAQLEQQYGKEQSQIIQDNTILVYLQLRDPKSISNAVDLCGSYYDRELSVHTNSKLSGTVSWKEKKIFDKSDFTSLVERKSVIVITPTGMNQIRKLMWFNTPYFKRIYKKLKGGTSSE